MDQGGSVSPARSKPKPLGIRPARRSSRRRRQAADGGDFHEQAGPVRSPAIARNAYARSPAPAIRPGPRRSSPQCGRRKQKLPRLEPTVAADTTRNCTRLYPSARFMVIDLAPRPAGRPRGRRARARNGRGTAPDRTEARATRPGNAAGHPAGERVTQTYRSLSPSRAAPMQQEVLSRPRLLVRALPGRRLDRASDAGTTDRSNASDGYPSANSRGHDTGF